MGLPTSPGCSHPAWSPRSRPAMLAALLHLSTCRGIGKCPAPVSGSPQRHVSMARGTCSGLLPQPPLPAGFFQRSLKNPPRWERQSPPRSLLPAGLRRGRNGFVASCLTLPAAPEISCLPGPCRLELPRGFFLGREDVAFALGEARLATEQGSAPLGLLSSQPAGGLCATPAASPAQPTALPASLPARHQ